MEEIAAHVRSKTRKLGPHSTRAVAMREVRDRIFGGRMNAFPDGQREIVCDEAWMVSLVSTLANVPIPLEPLLVNERADEALGDVWFVHRGKQRTSSLFAFFAGLVPVKVKGRDYFWIDKRDPPHGACYLFDKDNVTTAGVEDHCESPLPSLARWFAKLNLKDKLAPRTGARILPADLRDRFLASSIDFQILPDWPVDATSLCAVWGEVNCYKHTSAECIYGLPGLGDLKLIEGRVAALARSLGIVAEKQPFCDLCRVYMFMIGAEFVPLARDVDNYDAIITELSSDFVAKNGTSRETAAETIRAIAAGVDFLAENLAHLKGGNKVSRVRSMTSDSFVCIVVLAAKSRGLDAVNTAIELFRLSAAKRSKVIDDERFNSQWVISEERHRNLVGVIDVTLRL